VERDGRSIGTQAWGWGAEQPVRAALPHALPLWTQGAYPLR